MNRTFYLAALTGIALVGQSAPGPSAGQADPKVVEELTAIERRWAEALVKGDPGMIEDRIAPEYVLVGPWGKSTREEDLHGGSFLGAWKCTSWDAKVVEVRVYGTTALVLGTYAQRATYGGKPDDAKGLFMDVFVQVGGRWMAVSGQLTPTAP